MDNNVLACSFLPQSSTTISTYKRGVKGWILTCNDNTLQLYARERDAELRGAVARPDAKLDALRAAVDAGQRANTFIFMTRPAEQSGADIITSIALQNFSRFVQEVRGYSSQLMYTSNFFSSSQQYGRIYRTAVTSIEIHVVSNRDRVAHQLFDLRFEQYVPSRTPHFLR